MFEIKSCVMQFTQARKCDAAIVKGIRAVKGPPARCCNETGARRESVDGCKL